jgi:hypothetical protein
MAVVPFTGITDPIGETAQRNPLLALQREIVPALEDELDGICAVYDHVPEDADPPWVTWNTGWTAPRFTLGTPANRVWFQIDVWGPGSDARGYKQVSEIADLVIRRVSWANVVMDGYDPAQVFAEQQHTTRDPSGRLRRVAITFHLPFVAPLKPVGFTGFMFDGGGPFSLFDHELNAGDAHAAGGDDLDGGGA